MLEFDAVLARLAGRCETSLGEQFARDLLPDFDSDAVWASLGLTAEAYAAASNLTPPSLRPIHDLREAVAIAAKGGTLEGVDLFAVGDALGAMRALAAYLRSQRAVAPNLAQWSESLPDLQSLGAKILAAIDVNGEVKDSASPALGSLRQKVRSTSSRLVERIQSYASGKFRDLLSDPIYTVRNDRYVVPLKAENRAKLRGIVHDVSSTGQTLFVEPEEVVELGNKLREHESAVREEVSRILAALSDQVGEHAEEIAAGIETAAQIDLRFAKARLAFDMNADPPTRLQGSRIELVRARHPLLDPGIVVPLDISLGQGDSLLITGPNTGGKTVAIKCVGLCVLMAQSGLFPPASQCRLGPFSQVWADIGDEQSLQQSLSTFSGHIKNIAEALKSLKSGALVLLDEIGAGTDPAEGAALAKAVLLQMAEKGATILASTHYGELKVFAFDSPGFRNAAMEFDLKTLRPTFRLMMGAAGSSQALRVAERFGIPREVVTSAMQLMSEEHRATAELFEKLDKAERHARTAQSEADRRLHALTQAEEKATKKLHEAEAARRSAREDATAELQSQLREIRLQAADLFEQMKKVAAGSPELESARESLNRIQRTGQEAIAKLESPKSQEPEPAQSLRPGESVRIEGYNQIGTLLELQKGGQALVQVGSLKMTVRQADLRAVPKAQAAPKSVGSVNRLQRALNSSTELHLRHQRAEEAEILLAKFIDDAVLAGLHAVRIVHGKGEGILRALTREFLRKHPDVANFRDGEPGEGGQGVTVATFK